MIYRLPFLCFVIMTLPLVVLSQNIQSIREDSISYHRHFEREGDSLSAVRNYSKSFKLLPNRGILEIDTVNESGTPFVSLLKFNQYDQFVYDSGFDLIRSTNFILKKPGEASYAVDTELTQLRELPTILRNRIRQGETPHRWDTIIRIRIGTSKDGKHFEEKTGSRVVHRRVHNDSIAEYYEANVLDRIVDKCWDKFGRLAHYGWRTFKNGKLHTIGTSKVDYTHPHHILTSRSVITSDGDTTFESLSDFDSTTNCAKDITLSRGERSVQTICYDSTRTPISMDDNGHHYTYENSHNADSTEYYERTYRDGILTVESVDKYEYALYKK